jgi:hypothetical protein
VGATDSSAQLLRPVTESDVTRAEEGFKEVAGAQQRHGWGGGWLVACRGQRQVKVTEKDGEKKNEDPAKKRG